MLETFTRVDMDRFCQSVAHDLRAPVRGMVGFSQLVLEDQKTQLSLESKSHLTKIIKAGQKMGMIIDGLIKLSLLGAKPLVKEKVDLSNLMLEIAQETQKSSTLLSGTFSIIPGVVVNGDSSLLRIALENLVVNALKYSSKNRQAVKIEFGVTEQNGERVFFIKDNGVGFDMKSADRLFQVFQRLHSAEEFEGTGLGLVTTQRIILSHGGRIWATSEVNKGATFFFTI